MQPASPVVVIPSRFRGIDRALGWLTEVPAALLVVAEIVILFAGVVSRYIFNKPLTWSDELASVLFLWLAMLGAVIALRRGEHMRLTTFVNLLRPQWRAWVDTVSALIVIVFVLLILSPSWEYITNQWLITTPALELHDAVRVAAIGVGAVLMMLIALVRLAERATARQVASAVVVLAVAIIGLWLLRPVFATLGNVNLIIFFVGMVALCVVMGVPIAFAFGIATLSYLALTTRTPLTIVVSRMDEGMSTLILLSVPLFVFLGALIEMTGLARAMVDFLATLLGHVRGGLQYVLLGAIYLVSGISGSKAADMAAVAPALFPEMKRRGAHEGDLVALLSSSGAMSETIPPSLVLITIGSVTGVSIAALFTGGLLPAVVGMIALGVLVFFETRREKTTGIARATGAQIVRSLLIAVPALALPVVIRTVVVEGVATATEVSTVGVVYTIVAGLLIYRQFDVKRLFPMFVDTAALSGAILLIIGCATGMAWALTQSGFSRQLVTVMSAVPGGQAGFLAISVVAFVVLGSVLEGIPAIVLFGPLLFPVARALGVHEVHYAMVVIFAMGLGLFAPPFGVGFYAACAIGKVSPDVAMPRVWRYLAALFVALVIIAAVPWLSIGFL
ncbi:MAG: TRAP transporter large permease subunit [Aromatoleum sp.]|nr:TRAP transporter large permease subunit [Aromatoleum sp.]